MRDAPSRTSIYVFAVTLLVLSAAGASIKPPEPLMTFNPPTRSLRTLLLALTVITVALTRAPISIVAVLVTLLLLYAPLPPAREALTLSISVSNLEVLSIVRTKFVTDRKRVTSPPDAPIFTVLVLLVVVSTVRAFPLITPPAPEIPRP